MIHMTSTHQTLSGRFFVGCRCEWASGPHDSRPEARQAGDAHLAVANGPRFHVVDNITGERVSKDFETEDGANRVCYDMNLRAGPGGRYGVENEKGERV